MGRSERDGSPYDALPANRQDVARRTWIDSARGGIRTGLATVTLIGMASSGAVAPGFFPRLDAIAALGLALVGLAEIAILGILWRGAKGWGWSLLVTVLTVAGVALAVSGMTVAPERSDIWWPRTVIVSVTAFLVVSHRRGWILSSAVILANAVIHALAWQPSPSLPELTRLREVGAELGQLAAFCLVAFFAARASTVAAARADASVEQGRPARTAHAAQRAAAIQMKEADRFVHDEILHTLRLIAMDRSSAPAPAALASVQRLRPILDLQSIAHADDDFVDMIRRETADLGVAVDVVGPSGIQLPRDVSTALVSALRECVRNAARHSGANQVTIEARRGHLALSLTVRDSGRGFDTRQTEGRIGLQQSVLARVTEVGGAVRVVSSPGAGTSVTLRWSPIPQVSFTPVEIGGGAFADFLPWLSIVILPVFGQALWAAAFLTPGTRWPVVSILATVALVAVGVWSLLWGIRHGLRPWQSVALGVIAWGVSVLSVLGLPSAAPHPRLLWLVVAAGAISSVLSLYRPLWEAVVAGIGVSIVTAATIVAHQPGAPLVAYAQVLLSPIISVAVAIVVRTHVDRCAYEIWTNEERLRDRDSGMVVGDLFQSRVRQRMHGRTEELVDLLETVETDPDSLHDDRIRQRADDLERGLRDVIADSADPTLIAAMARLRRAGWDLHSRFGDDMPLEVQGVIAGALARLPIEGHRSGQSLTATASLRADVWRVSLLVRPGGRKVARLFGEDARWEVEAADGVQAVTYVPRGAVAEGIDPGYALDGPAWTSAPERRNA